MEQEAALEKSWRREEKFVVGRRAATLMQVYDNTQVVVICFQLPDGFA
jgi:hypothetical protein